MNHRYVTLQQIKTSYRRWWIFQVETLSM